MDDDEKEIAPGPGFGYLSDMTGNADDAQSGDASTRQRAIRRFSRKVTSVLALKFMLSFITIWFFGWGTVVLAVRAAANTPARLLLWGALALVPIILISVIFARRRSPARSAVCAVLDRQSECGGLLMAGDQIDLGDWQTPPIILPRVRWRNGRAWGLFFTAAAFAAITFLVPVRFAALAGERPLDITRETEKLADQIEALQKEDIIDADKVDSLEQKLEEIRRDASGEEPAKTWEALDHLQDAVAKTTREATDKIAADSQRLGQAEALSKALVQDGSSMDSSLATESMKELSELTEGALKDSGLSQQALDELKSGSLSKEQLKELSGALSKMKGKLSERLAALRDAGLIDMKTLKKCEGAGQCDSAGLADFLKENEGDMSVSDLMAIWSTPGKGGVSRGRGDAPMTWSDGTSEQGAKFREQVLSPSALAGLKDSQLVGRSLGAPTVERAVAHSGALATASTGGGSAITQSVLPRHKGAVRRYFERP